MEARAVDDAAGVIMAVLDMSPAQLKAALEEVFLDHDVDCNGVLDQAEFSRCISQLGGRLNLDKAVVRDIFRAVDVNGDGVVDWKEFVGPAVKIIAASIEGTGSPTEEDLVAAEAEAEENKMAILNQRATDFMLRHTSEEELMDGMTKLFKSADADDSGTITPLEAYDLVKSQRVGGVAGWDLSDQEISYLLYQLDTNRDGLINVSEFLPVAFQMLVDSVVAMHSWEELEASAIAEVAIKVEHGHRMKQVLQAGERAVMVNGSHFSVQPLPVAVVREEKAGVGRWIGGVHIPSPFVREEIASSPPSSLQEEYRKAISGKDIRVQQLDATNPEFCEMLIRRTDPASQSHRRSQTTRQREEEKRCAVCPACSEQGLLNSQLNIAHTEQEDLLEGTQLCKCSKCGYETAAVHWCEAGKDTMAECSLAEYNQQCLLARGY
jgi:Ca2+-binding EF-hand superfamily protein